MRQMRSWLPFARGSIPSVSQRVRTHGHVTLLSSVRGAASVHNTTPFMDLSAVPKPSPEEVATYMYASKRHHQKLHAAESYGSCRILEAEVWRVLQTLTDEDVEKAPVKDACELLVAWNYFGRFWGNGMDGPSDSHLAAVDGGKFKVIDGVARESGSGDGESAETALKVPLVTREADDAAREKNARADVMAPARRADPLDEILDF